MESKMEIPENEQNIPGAKLTFVYRLDSCSRYYSLLGIYEDTPVLQATLDGCPTPSLYKDIALEFMKKWLAEHLKNENHEKAKETVNTIKLIKNNKIVYRLFMTVFEGDLEIVKCIG